VNTEERAEDDYDSLTAVRMAIVERDDRLAVLMPATTTFDEAQQLRDTMVAYGWTVDRVLVMVGPTAFAVVKPHDSEGPLTDATPTEEQPEGVPWS
jgi:hypothetical protein